MLTKKTKKKSSDEELDLVKTVLTVSPRSIHDKQIPDAEVEIRSVIDTTEDTAGTILDVAERLSELADGSKGKMSKELMALSTTLFEASSFQDLCGQRLNKVLRAMDSIAADLYIISMASGDIRPPRESEDEEVEYDEDGHVVNSATLLRGPQHADEAISQEDIDALLADFD